jgi:hypothetical protein
MSFAAEREGQITGNLLACSAILMQPLQEPRPRMMTKTVNILIVYGWLAEFGVWWK